MFKIRFKTLAYDNFSEQEVLYHFNKKKRSKASETVNPDRQVSICMSF